MFKQEKKQNKPKNIKGGKSLQEACDAHQRYILKTNPEDLNKAITGYIDVIKKNPKIPEAYYRLATLMYENKQITLDSAISQCEQAVKIAPESSDAHIYLGYFLSLAGEGERAEEHFKTAVKINPLNSARVRLIMGLDAYENNGFKNKLKATYLTISGFLFSLIDKNSMKMFFKNFADNLNYAKYQTIGGIYEKLNKPEIAYKTYYKALDECKNQHILYEKMANLASLKEKNDIALHCFQNAVKLSNDNPATIVDMIEFIEEKYPERVDDLIDSYNLLVRKNPEFSRCYYELGHLYLKKNELLNAVNAFQYALDLEENNPFYLNSMAFAQVQLEQYDEAIKLYKKAITLNPDKEWTAIVVQALAMLYHQVKNEPNIAISLLANALMMTEKKAPIYQIIADIHYDLGEVEEALDYYKRALEHDIENPRAYSRLAMVCWEKDILDEAIINYKKAIEIDPMYDIAYNNLGVIYLDGINNIEKAKLHFSKAIEIRYEYALAHFNLGRVYEAKGDKILAAEEYQKTIDINKKTFEIDENIVSERLFKLFET